MATFVAGNRKGWSPDQVLVDVSGTMVSNSSICQMWSVSPAAMAGERLVQRRLAASSGLSILKVFSARPKS